MLRKGGWAGASYAWGRGEGRAPGSPWKEHRLSLGGISWDYLPILGQCLCELLETLQILSYILFSLMGQYLPICFLETGEGEEMEEFVCVCWEGLVLKKIAVGGQ